MAELLGASRVTARRHLEYLVEQNAVLRQARYKATGRPEMEYVVRAGAGQP